MRTRIALRVPFARSMLQWWRKARASLPAHFFEALAVCAGFLLFVTWDQCHWWRTKQDYSFGWLVPLFVAFVVQDRWPKIGDALSACSACGAPRVAGVEGVVLDIFVALVLMSGAGMFLLGAFYRAGAGPSNPGTLAITLGMVAIVLPLIFIHAPRSNAPRRCHAFGDTRLRLVMLFIFPALVWLVSAPMVSVLEVRLNLLLLRKVVTVVAFVFDSLGLPIEQQGNVLALPMGAVGVEDACSGIRSLTGCLFAGSFIAAAFIAALWKKIVLLVAALALAFVTNLARSLFLTAWAYNHGPEAIRGPVHDVAGYAVMSLTVLGLVCLVPLLNLRLTGESPRPSRSNQGA